MLTNCTIRGQMNSLTGGGGGLEWRGLSPSFTCKSGVTAISASIVEFIVMIIGTRSFTVTLSNGGGLITAGRG